MDDGTKKRMNTAKRFVDGNSCWFISRLLQRSSVHPSARRHYAYPAFFITCRYCSSRFSAADQLMFFMKASM